MYVPTSITNIFILYYKILIMDFIIQSFVIVVANSRMFPPDISTNNDTSLVLPKSTVPNSANSTVDPLYVTMIVPALEFVVLFIV